MLVVEALLRRRLDSLLAGLLLVGAALIGVVDAVEFVARHTAEALGVALLLDAAALAVITGREALSRQ